MTKKISILGSTGSIGQSTLDVVALHPNCFKVVALAAGTNLDKLTEQIKKFHPQLVSVKTEEEVPLLKEKLSGLSSYPDIVCGLQGTMAVADCPEVDLVISAIVGAAGLQPTLQAIRSGKTIGLANKESMVIAGELMRQAAQKSGSIILPVDSEHSAIFQCLQGNRTQDVKRLILTASGGPFLNRPLADFHSITKAEALRHPNWAMGMKITIDSATMMNKGLEVMEARWLFDFPIDRIDVCIHPQSIIHSMVEYVDGSVISQMGVPDMKVPIGYALSYPERLETGAVPLDLFAKKELNFYPPDFEKFTSLKTAYDVGRAGKSYPAVFNAANEVTVEAFLHDRIRFVDIAPLNKKAIEAHNSFELKSLEDVLEADRWARDYTQRLVV